MLFQWQTINEKRKIASNAIQPKCNVKARGACLFTINGYLLRQVQSMLKSKCDKKKRKKTKK